MKDFFTRYEQSRKHHYFMPAIFGLLLGFAIVAQMTGTPIDLGSIQANVLEANTPKVTYNADLIMERSDTSITVRIGKDAQNIDTLTFSLLGDPNIFAGLSSSASDTTIANNETGVYLVKVNVGKSLRAGDIVTILTPNLSGKTSIAMIDAGFTSSGTLYSMSVKGE